MFFAHSNSFSRLIFHINLLLLRFKKYHFDTFFVSCSCDYKAAVPKLYPVPFQNYFKVFLCKIRVVIFSIRTLAKRFPLSFNIFFYCSQPHSTVFFKPSGLSTQDNTFFTHKAHLLTIIIVYLYYNCSLRNNLTMMDIMNTIIPQSPKVKIKQYAVVLLNESTSCSAPSPTPIYF